MVSSELLDAGSLPAADRSMGRPEPHQDGPVCRRQRRQKDTLAVGDVDDADSREVVPADRRDGRGWWWRCGGCGWWWWRCGGCGWWWWRCGGCGWWWWRCGGRGWRCGSHGRRCGRCGGWWCGGGCGRWWGSRGRWFGGCGWWRWCGGGRRRLRRLWRGSVDRLRGGLGRGLHFRRRGRRGSLGSGVRHRSGSRRRRRDGGRCGGRGPLVSVLGVATRSGAQHRDDQYGDAQNRQGGRSASRIVVMVPGCADDRSLPRRPAGGTPSRGFVPQKVAMVFSTVAGSIPP